jgi:hypothetical protein
MYFRLIVDLWCANRRWFALVGVDVVDAEKRLEAAPYVQSNDYGAAAAEFNLHLVSPVTQRPKLRGPLEAHFAVSCGAQWGHVQYGAALTPR